MKRAETLGEIIDVTRYDVPVDNTNPFFVDFTNLRKDFKIKRIYKSLRIEDDNCNSTQPIKFFIAGHRGTGKTSELLTLANHIEETNCFLVTFVDLADGRADPNNIEIVDILLLLLEELIKKLKDKGATVSENILEPFYNWYQTRVMEIENKTGINLDINSSASAGVSLFSFFKLNTALTSKFSSQNTTKDIIRQEFNNKISDFLKKFNEFLLALEQELSSIDNSYKDILFIVDGFEKLGTNELREKILYNNITQFNYIQTNMIFTLPLELKMHKATYDSLGIDIIDYPLIDIEDATAREKMKEFILKRVNKNLFEEGCIDLIIEYGAGSPRETLRILKESYLQEENGIIDKESILNAVEKLGKELIETITNDELQIIKDVKNDKIIAVDQHKFNLLYKKVLLEYGYDNPRINPILFKNEKFNKLIENDW